ncbi:MAG: GlcG/HbpS family heme-binding protein, partial [Candidatus Binatia bacterium]
NIAASLARTTAFFSNSQAPLSSRTVQFLSTFHFPPRFELPFQASPCPSSGGGCGSTVIAPQLTTGGVAGTDQGPLWQINATNRGAPIADVAGTAFNAGQAYPRSLNIDGSFPSPGITLLPGAVPLYKQGPGVGVDVSVRLVGGVGVYGVSPEAAEFAALSGSEGYRFPGNVPPAGAVVLGGIRLPFVAQTTRPEGFGPGTFGQGRFVVAPRNGSIDPFGYLIGPRPSPIGNFPQESVEQIINQAIESANGIRASVRLPGGSTTFVIMVITDLDGLILAHFRMEDTLTDAIDVVPAKARSVVYYSRPEGPAPEDAIPGIPNGTAITTTTLGFLSQPFFPPGIDGTEEGPLFQLALLNQTPGQATRLGRAPASPGLQNGLTFFPGAVPLYDGAGNLIGGLGVSGDGVENNDQIAAAGARGFEPPREIRADRFTFRGERLPYLKFNRSPGK